MRNGIQNRRCCQGFVGSGGQKWKSRTTQLNAEQANSKVAAASPTDRVKPFQCKTHAVEVHMTDGTVRIRSVFGHQLSDGLCGFFFPRRQFGNIGGRRWKVLTQQMVNGPEPTLYWTCS